MHSVDSILISVAAGVVVVVILEIWRRAARALSKFEKALIAVEAFGAQWTAAAALADVIRAQQSLLVDTHDLVKTLAGRLVDNAAASSDLVGQMVHAATPPEKEPTPT